MLLLEIFIHESDSRPSNEFPLILQWNQMLCLLQQGFFSVEKTMRWHIHHQGSRAGAEGLEEEIALLWTHAWAKERRKINDRWMLQKWGFFSKWCPSGGDITLHHSQIISSLPGVQPSSAGSHQTFLMLLVSWDSAPAFGLPELCAGAAAALHWSQELSHSSSSKSHLMLLLVRLCLCSRERKENKSYCCLWNGSSVPPQSVSLTRTLQNKLKSFYAQHCVK